MSLERSRRPEILPSLVGSLEGLRLVLSGLLSSRDT